MGVVVEIFLLVLHMVGVVFMFEDISRDLILLVLILCANMAIGVLDLQYIHMCMVLCKRFRTLNKIIQHIVKPFRTFRAEEPTNEMKSVQDNQKDPVKIDMSKEDVPTAL